MRATPGMLRGNRSESSNGDVIIGRPDDGKELRDIKVTKTWDDNDDQHKLRPEYIKIWLVRNGCNKAYLQRGVIQPIN